MDVKKRKTIVRMVGVAFVLLGVIPLLLCAVMLCCLPSIGEICGILLIILIGVFLLRFKDWARKTILFLALFWTAVSIFGLIYVPICGTQNVHITFFYTIDNPPMWLALGADIFSLLFSLIIFYFFHSQETRFLFQKDINRRAIGRVKHIPPPETGKQIC